MLNGCRPPLSAFCARCEGRRGRRVSAFVHVRTVGVLKRLFMIQERIRILCHVRPRCMRRLHRVSCGGARVADRAFASCLQATGRATPLVFPIVVPRILCPGRKILNTIHRCEVSHKCHTCQKKLRCTFAQMLRCSDAEVGQDRASGVD